MKMSGSTRREEDKSRRSLGCWLSPRPSTLPGGTASPGPDDHHTEPGPLFSVGIAGAIYTFLFALGPSARGYFVFHSAGTSILLGGGAENPS